MGRDHCLRRSTASHTLHLPNRLKIIPLKIRVIIRATIWALLDPTEAVKIQLTLEGSEFRVFEVLDEEHIPEGVRIIDDKGKAVLTPANSVRRLGFKHFVQTRWEGSRTPTLVFLGNSRCSLLGHDLKFN